MDTKRKRSNHGNLINPFIPNAPFLYPLKPSENRKGALGTNELRYKQVVYLFSIRHNNIVETVKEKTKRIPHNDIPLLIQIKRLLLCYL